RRRIVDALMLARYAWNRGEPPQVFQRLRQMVLDILFKLAQHIRHASYPSVKNRRFCPVAERSLFIVYIAWHSSRFEHKWMFHHMDAPTTATCLLDTTGTLGIAQYYTRYAQGSGVSQPAFWRVGAYHFSVVRSCVVASLRRRIHA